ncbi:EAL domain-containing protein [Aliiglaciecola sp. 2_MG-2023]|uniref:bifunctional diguanylate cyclase/phosphodiesterase n=1 Tax=unclassified Aliiglaciecola TaxID=2593648 RepID=UPI0026E13CF5|nr:MULTISPECIES: EAL domain-containing protein [unclassified Aliiglaciecola]MDO6712197.1 EAL domain-containing protein [Aliiglaciecola sp. 2_MG-2023]MDO6753565.1 EAL domain-containing protein [Aliiglaciecola sp. 1_MG-2023]
MPLSRQLGLSLLLVLCCVFIGSIWINVSKTREFVTQQLSSHAQDAATSLGLSISPYMGEESDIPVIETMVNAIFDSGYYLSITLKDLDDNTLLEKLNPSQIDTVPNWFIDLFPLNPPVAKTQINSGWSIVGSLSVISNPGIGYKQLWNNTKQTMLMFAVIFILALLFNLYLVKIITTPIKAVVSQATSISQRRFDQINPLPRTPELREFVLAINKMSAMLSKIFTQLADQAERYRQFAYTDSLTGADNRRAFKLTLTNMLADIEHQPNGYVFIVRLNSLAHVNKQYGVQNGDAYIKAVWKILNQHAIEPDSTVSIYRISGADFAVIIEDNDLENCQQLADSFVNQFNDIEKTEFAQGTAHIGISKFSYGDNFTKVLESADSALASALELPKKWQIASNLDIRQSNAIWRDQLQLLVTEGSINFVAQPIQSWDGQIIYKEWFARFTLPNTLSPLPMAQLIPASMRLDFSQQLDEMVIRDAINQLNVHSDTIGINVTRSSLAKQRFHQWLIDELPQESALCARIVVEIPERALVNHLQGLDKLVAKLKSKGVRITVERFGAQLAAVSHLQKIRPDYLKIDGRYTRQIHNEPDNQLFVQTLVSIAHGLNIKVISEVVETELEARCLQELFVDHVQGFYISKPIPIQS